MVGITAEEVKIHIKTRTENVHFRVCPADAGSPA